MTGDGLRTAGDERRLVGSDPEMGKWATAAVVRYLSPLETSPFRGTFLLGDEELLEISSDGRVRSSN